MWVEKREKVGKKEGGERKRKRCKREMNDETTCANEGRDRGLLPVPVPRQLALESAHNSHATDGSLLLL